MGRYDNAFETETRDLLELAKQAQLPKPLFREEPVNRILQAFSANRCVLVAGPPGAGKTSTIYALAHQMRISRHRGLRELATITILSGTHYLGDWQSKAQAIFDKAKQKKSVLYFTDIWNLRTVGSSSNNPSTIFDYLHSYLQAGELLLLGEVTEQQLAEMHKHPKLAGIFEIVRIEPLEEKQIHAIVRAEVERLRLPVAADTVARIFDLCRQFQGQSDSPGPAVRLVQQVAHYQQQKKQVDEPEACDAVFVDKVFSIYSGLPLFVISREHVKPAGEIRDWFHRRIIGQNEAVEAVLETIALYKAGLHDAKRPIGTFLFVGPTGVGKTELAKALAAFLFGSETRLLRFDMSEFKDYHAFERLVGIAGDATLPARLLDPVRTQPFQVILLDEIEKAHSNVWDLLLQLLDEGRLSAPRGGTVNFRNTIIIATSNAGAREMNRNSIGFAEAGNGRETHEIRKHLEQVFRPELINRFQHLVLFHGLARKDVTRIAERELEMVLAREGISSRNLIVEVGDDVLEHAVEHGYDQRYGARALKRELQRRVVLPIANFLLENRVYPGALLKLDIAHGLTRVRLLETDQSREHKQQAEPVTAADGNQYSLQDLRRQCRDLRAQLQTLARQLDEPGLRKQLKQHDQARGQADFWNHREQAYRQIVQAEHIARTLNRLERLHTELHDIEQRLQGAPGREQLQYTAQHLLDHRQRQDTARRELLLMGDDYRHDALVQIQPIAGKQQGAQELRDLLFNIYRDWAESRQYAVTVISEPLDDHDSAALWIQGAYAGGYLNAEAGIHRLREGDNSQVARVTVAALIDSDDNNIAIGRHDAFKLNGAYGGRVRSRLEIEHPQGGPKLILQNANILNKNRELAGQLGPAWHQTAHSGDDIVRRYNLNPFLVRDPLLELNSGKPDLLKPEAFHNLLSQRAELIFGKIEKQSPPKG